MSDARLAILTQIRAQLGPAVAPRLGSYEAIPRAYTQRGSLGSQALLQLLLERLADYDAEVITLEEVDIAHSVAEVLKRDGESVLLAPAAVPDSWLPAGIEILRDTSPDASSETFDPPGALSLEALTRAHAVLTTCAGAIAETGTILLTHGPQPGRRVLSLLPDHHLCVLRRDQIVETVSEGFALLDQAKSAALTTVSGPSATADIEMTRIRGVHGPRRLTVLLQS
jgi:L-lactate dehydrogenase complex protein LldG